MWKIKVSRGGFSEKIPDPNGSFQVSTHLCQRTIGSAFYPVNTEAGLEEHRGRRQPVHLH